MRVAVTGASGTVGRAFSKLMRAHGHEVLSLVRDPAKLADADALHGIFDMGEDPCCDPDVLRGVDAVVHLAAAVFVAPRTRGDKMALWSVNVLGTGGLIEAMAEADVRHLVLASASNIYDPGLEVAAEDSLARPERRTLYLGSKIAQELYASELCRRHDITLAVMRIASVANTGGDLVTRIVRRVLAGQDPGVDNPEYGSDFVALGDVVRGLQIACENGLEGIFNLSSGRRTTLGEIVELASGGDTKPAATMSASGGDAGFAAADCSRLAANGYAPMSIDQLVDVIRSAVPEASTDMAAELP